MTGKGQKLLAVLIDPDKVEISTLKNFIEKVNASMATLIFVGGSEVEDSKTDKVVESIKSHTDLPIVLFPGDITQISERADALLFLSLLSGRNPDYLIGKHVEAVPKLKNTLLEVIPTGYLLIENGKQTSVQKVTKTQPMSRDHVQQVVATAKAGEYLGMQLIYLEAGSGAKKIIPLEMIKSVRTAVNIPLIVGGGITSRKALDEVFNAGADVAVIGTALENDESFFNAIKNK